MCLYPKKILNPMYLPNKKNGGDPPPVNEKLKYIPTTCGKCIECRKQRSGGWRARILEEVLLNNKGTFVTLTFSDEKMLELRDAVLAEKPELHGYSLENQIATLAVRRFLERWRKETGKSIKHWLVTELGHKNTERIHLHGIIWSKDTKTIERLWQYGSRNYYGTYLNERTAIYITKYITKTDIDHPNYNPIVLTSPGIGQNFINTPRAKDAEFRGENGKDTRTYYKYPNGTKGNMPRYYKLKLYTDEQRQILWLNMIDQHIMWVCGEKCEEWDTTEEGYQKYLDCRAYHRERNNRLGYGTDIKSADEILLENYKRDELMIKRLVKEGRINYETGEIYNDATGTGKPRNKRPYRTGGEKPKKIIRLQRYDRDIRERGRYEEVYERGT